MPQGSSGGHSTAPTVDQPAYQVDASYLANRDSADSAPATASGLTPQNPSGTASKGARMQRISSLPSSQSAQQHSPLLTDSFSAVPSLDVSADSMPLADFLHYVFGELLNVNYVIDEGLKGDTKPITLNIRDKISPRRLMQLSQELLSQRNIQISYDDDLYFVHPMKSGAKGDVVTAIGSNPAAVPRTAQQILQVVPLKYGVRLSIERTLRQLVGAEITPDFDQGALFIKGKREDVLRALELVKMLDVPSNRGRYIGLLSLTYISGADFADQVASLLANEGIPVGASSGSSSSGGNSSGKSLSIVPIEQIGAVAVFASEGYMLDRVRYWAEMVDRPSQGTNLQYFIYHPRYARASDLGDSLSALISGTSSGSAASKTKTDASSSQVSAKETTGQAPSVSRKTGAKNDNLSFVVDERANALIFQATGADYQALLPLIQKLDVLPRQVMLDITIAEVTLSDEFKYGVEWAFNKGDFSMGTKGALGVEDFGGFSAILTGASGEISANFYENNRLVNVLSRPTLLVRDGVAASITVGTEISVVGSTTSDPITGDRQTTSSTYRKTGVNVSVTPSINAQGIVIMEIDQSISNTVTGTSGASGNPDIFERGLKTEVVAQSGQTVLLGGLISENGNNNITKTPGVASIPLIGELFKGTEKSSSRTELVMLITPRVVERTDQWDELTDSFERGLRNLKMGNLAPQQPTPVPAVSPAAGATLSE